MWSPVQFPRKDGVLLWYQFLDRRLAEREIVGTVWLCTHLYTCVRAELSAELVAIFTKYSAKLRGKQSLTVCCYLLNCFNLK